MPIVTAIDYSTTKTGIARITRKADGSVIATSLINRTPWTTDKRVRAKKGLPETIGLGERRERIATGAQEAIRFGLGSDLVVIAAPLTSAPGQGKTRVDLLAGWWFVVGPLLRAGVPVASAVDSTMKKAFTDDRAADKVKVAATALRLYPDLELDGDDASDAVGFAHMGAAALGWVPILERYRGMKWAEWPESLASPFPPKSTAERLGIEEAA